MTNAVAKQVLREHELMREKLRQIFLDANHAYNYVYDHKHDEALTALSVVIMEIVTVLQEVLALYLQASYFTESLTSGSSP